MIYKGKKLDRFQIEAIECVSRYENVIVSAPTGTGKTMVADYCIEKCLQEGYRVAYTAPIKALSNQKYREFSDILGSENVGVLTGDTVINKNAPFLIMTTEIYRNILYSDVELANDIKCVIFDEIHYISDEDRGTVWEESILMKPKNTFLVGLSATIPNISDLAGWIEKVKGEKVNIIYHDKRAVPLSHNMYYCGEIIPISNIDSLESYSDDKNDENEYLNLLNKFDVCDFPVLYFSFNRRGCYDKAMEYSKDKKVRDDETIKKIKEIVNKVLKQYDRDEDSIADYKTYLNLFYKGIGVHHAGVLPILKLIVEELFEKRLLNVIFCTETFAIGINYPVKTVCIDGYRKFDGHDFRNLLNNEYFQIGGRAGRRGIDEYGTVITLIKPSDVRFADYPIWSEDNMELLRSNFKISYNSTIQMFMDESKDIERILKDNFALYLMNKQRDIFRESKEDFLNDISKIKESCCMEMGKNSCPIHYNKLLQQMEDSVLCEKSKKERDRKKKELKIFKGKKIKNCTREQKRYCKEKYKEYSFFVDSYLEEKKLYEDYYTKYPDDYFLTQYENKKKLLDSMGYIRLETNETLVRGRTMRNIYIQELLLCELIYSDFFDKYDEEVICGIISGIDFDGVKISKEQGLKEVMIDAYLDVIKQVNRLSEIELDILGSINVKYDVAPCNIAYKIASGCSISEIIEEINVSDGDVVSIARRTLAILSEIKEAVADRPYLVEKLKSCISKIDRDEYKALF